MKRAAVFLLMVMALLPGCSSSTDATADSGLEMTREELGEDWPFTVDQGIVTCEGAGEVYFQSGGVVYPVNGTAQGVSDGPDIEAIWADDPYFEGNKINIHPIIERGLELCE